MALTQLVFARPSPARARITALAAIISLAAACDPEVVPTPNVGLATISGRVVGLDGRPVAGAMVAPAEGDTTRTDSLGRFSLSGMRPTERLAVNVTSDAFVATTAVYPVQAGRETFRILELIPRAPAQRLDAAAGGEVPLGRGGSVRLDPGSLVDAAGRPAQGTVLVRATYIDPSDTTQVLVAPGDYLSAVRGGVGAPLETFGMVEINVTDVAGRVLQLAEGRSAAVRWPRVTDQSGGGLFVFDRANGTWNRRNDVIIDRTLIRNLVEINNWDIDFPVVCIKVNAGAPGVRVVAQGLNYSSATDGWSDASGMVLLGVRASSSVKVGVHPFNPLATAQVSTPAGPIVPPNTPFATQPERQAACPTGLTPTRLTTRPDWIDDRRIDAIIAR